MPTVLRLGPYRFYFWSHELNEPPHVHVDRDEKTAKYWLSPIRLAHMAGFREHELRRIEAIIAENEAEFLEAWHEHFRPGGR